MDDGHERQAWSGGERLVLWTVITVIGGHITAGGEMTLLDGVTSG